MRCYRVELQLRSGLGTPLSADTLWGHIAWGIRYRQGNAALEDWLQSYDGPHPPLVLSDPLPHGFFPRPCLPSPQRPAKLPSKEEADRLKRQDKRSWIHSEHWRQIAGSVTPASVRQVAADPPNAYPMAVTRAGVNRLTGGTAQAEGGTLFTVEQVYHPFDPPARFDVWCYCPHEPETLQQWFADGLVGGYGRDGSAGLGYLTTASIEQAALPDPGQANACVLLGPVVPKATDPLRGFFRFGIRCGRLGGQFAIGPLPRGATSRQKLPVRVLLAGTVLVPTGNVPRFVGRVPAGVHPQLPGIRHYGMAPVLPCRLQGQLLQHPLLTASDPAARSLPEGCYQPGGPV